MYTAENIQQQLKIQKEYKEIASYGKVTEEKAKLLLLTEAQILQLNALKKHIFGAEKYKNFAREAQLNEAMTKEMTSWFGDYQIYSQFEKKYDNAFVMQSQLKATIDSAYDSASDCDDSSDYDDSADVDVTANVLTPQLTLEQENIDPKKRNGANFVASFMSLGFNSEKTESDRKNKRIRMGEQIQSEIVVQNASNQIKYYFQ